MKKILGLSICSILLMGCSLLNSLKYKDFDIIDTKDPIDERTLIEETMSRQRQLLKPGFITEQSNWENGFEFFFQETSFDATTEELMHTVTYIHTASDTYLPFLATKDTEYDQYFETVESLKDSQPLEKIEGYYGYIEEEGEKYYQYIAKKEDVIYYFENTENEEEWLDADLVSKMANALKTEEEGTYSHFYERFKFDLDDLHFPQLNKEHIENTKVKIGDLGHWEFDNNNFIKITYDFYDDTQLHFYNYGVDLYTPQATNTKIKEEETNGGVKVTTFDTDLEFRTVYLWEADGHYYVIELDMNDNTLSNENVYAIIDSSRDDSRKFSDENIFKSTNKEPTLNDLDKEILQNFSEIED